jgi:hypothetical protein
LLISYPGLSLLSQAYATCSQYIWPEAARARILFRTGLRLRLFFFWFLLALILWMGKILPQELSLSVPDSGFQTWAHSLQKGKEWTIIENFL